MLIDYQLSPVVRIQHRYFGNHPFLNSNSCSFSAVLIAVMMGLILPTIIAMSWNDAAGGIVWGALVARVVGKSSISPCVFTHSDSHK